METIFSDINGPGGPLYNLHAFLVQGDRLFAVTGVYHALLTQQSTVNVLTITSGSTGNVSYNGPE